MIDVVGGFREDAGRARSPGSPLGTDLVGRLAECQGGGLGEEVGQEQRVDIVVAVDQRVRGLATAMKSHGIIWCPDGSAGRRRAGRSCRARPRTPPQSRWSPANRRSAPLAVGFHGELLQHAGNRCRNWAYGRTAWLPALKKFPYQTFNRPMSAGTLLARSVSAKCRSIAWKPAKKSAKFAGPMATATDVPIAESTEYRPPTQSCEKPNAFSGSMPNAATLSSAVDTATKCLATAALDASSPASTAPDSRSLSSSQLRARRALVSVSKVVKVLEATMKSVVSGSRSLVFFCYVSRVNVGDESRRKAWLHVRLEGLVDHHRTKIRSTDPDVHHCCDRFAGDAYPFAAAHLVGEGVHLGQHLVYLGMTSVPSTIRLDPSGARSAVCSTARSSVTLMCFPANMASRRSTKPT